MQNDDAAPSPVAHARGRNHLPIFDRKNGWLENTLQVHRTQPSSQKRAVSHAHRLPVHVCTKNAAQDSGGVDAVRQGGDDQGQAQPNNVTAEITRPFSRSSHRPSAPFPPVGGASQGAFREVTTPHREEVARAPCRGGALLAPTPFSCKR